jgi:hypothetical protein
MDGVEGRGEGRARDSRFAGSAGEPVDDGLPTHLSSRCCLADEPAADFRPLLVDTALAVMEEFAAVFDDQFVGTVQRKMKPIGTESRQPLIFLPGEIDIRKGAATKRVALLAAGGSIQRMIK